MVLSLSQRDWQQQNTRFQGSIAVDELIKGWDIVDLDQEVPAVDEHGQAGTVNQSLFEDVYRDHVSSLSPFHRGVAEHFHYQRTKPMRTNNPTTNVAMTFADPHG